MWLRAKPHHALSIQKVNWLLLSNTLVLSLMKYPCKTLKNLQYFQMTSDSWPPNTPWPCSPATNWEVGMVSTNSRSSRRKYPEEVPGGSTQQKYLARAPCSGSISFFPIFFMSRKNRSISSFFASFYSFFTESFHQAQTSHFWRVLVKVLSCVPRQYTGRRTWEVHSTLQLKVFF